MRRLVSILLVVGACGAAVFLTAASGGGSATGKTYHIEFDNAFGLVEGGDLKIGGVKAGSTEDFKLTDSEPYKVLVEVKVTEPGFSALRKDATCAVRQQSLIGEYFIDCDLGEKTSPKLRDGGTVPAKQTSSTIPPDLINTVMRRPYRERFRLILNELGAGLAGRPRELNEVIRRAHPALRETTETFAILRRHNTVIRDFIKDADEVSANVEPVKEKVAQWAEEASDTAEIQASRREQLGRYWNRLPEFLRQLEPTMAELDRTARAQIPTLRKLQGAAPELERFLQDAQPFARASRKSIDDLGGAADAGNRAVKEAREEIRELKALAPFAVRAGKPLRQLLQTIDDRTRSIEDDPLAAQTSPPAPDKTAYKKGQGFTGMEALWNYFYYQTLAINPFDEFGHILRIGAFPAGPCAPYTGAPTKTVQDQCKSWLGPNQPGINAPDPTEGNIAARERAERRSATPQQRARQRGPGEPEAPPTPGKPDPSKPQIVLPDDVRKLLDRLKLDKPLQEQLPQVPQVPGGAPNGTEANQLLDYLLSP
jgi:ABC-type transporter Mla subunit MlaD